MDGLRNDSTMPAEMVRSDKFLTEEDKKAKARVRAAA